MRDARPVRRAAAAALVLVPVMLAACSGGGSSGGATSPSASATTSSATASPALRVARVAVLSSDTGVLGSTGKGVRDSVALALAEANADGTVPGWRFELVAKNDGGTQAAGQQAASGVAETPGVIGVVGTMRSTIDEGVQPILNNRGIPMISPAGTGAQLTRRLDGTDVVRPFPTYFRLSPTDGDQGRAAARYAAKKMHATRVAVVSDGSSYGRLLASGFAAEAKALGVARSVVRTVEVPTTLTTAAAEARRTKVADAVRKAKVGVVFFGGSAEASAAFAQTLTLERVRAPMMGGDSLFERSFLADAGALTAKGAYAVFPGAAADQLTTATGFLERYKAAGYGEDPGPYGANAYDAAQALVRAFEAAVGDNTQVNAFVRSAIVAEVGLTDFVGATGRVRFDAFGDAVDPPLSLYRYGTAGWQPSGVVRLG